MIERELAEKYRIFECLSGSYAYGTNLPTSDRDLRGIFIAPPEYYLGLKKCEQIEQKEPDRTLFELRKFVKLAADCNPNIIELLYTEGDSVVFADPIFEQLRANRHLFLSKKAKYTYSGYGMAQMKRIKGHKRWIVNPEPEEPPQLRTFATWISRPGWMIKPSQEQWDELHTKCFLVKTHGQKVFRLYESEQFTPGIVDADGTNLRQFDISQEKLTGKAEYRGILIVALEEFKEARKRWNQYWEWKKNRNPQRAELEEKYLFDCYSADTEFLTEDGWKFFDEITQDIRLATLNPKTFRLEYQSYLDKQDALHTGTMYSFGGYHTDIRVSGNHRMFMRQFSRNIRKLHQWKFLRACEVPDSFEILNVIKPKKRKFQNPSPCGLDLRLYLKIMGWYVSDGTIAHRLTSGSPSVLSFSQLKGGRLHWKISKAKYDYANDINIKEYSHYRKSKNRTEMIWTIANRLLAKTIVEECGEKSYNKKLPRWVFGLSKRMMVILLDALHAGDGTNRITQGITEGSSGKWNKKSQIYYTSSPALANDVQELAFLCGFETAKWGPYDPNNHWEHPMWQVHIRRQPRKNRQLIRYKNVKTENVKDERIVCFSVPNEILITRRNGRIAIQGNSKHAMHLVRLMKMAKEILTEGKVIVKRPDAQHLLDIRDGKFDYEWLLKWAEDTDSELDELYETSPLPFSADYKAISKLLMSMTQKYWKDKGLL